MTFKETILKGSYLIDINTFSDDRGWFARTYCKHEFKEIGHDKEWVQLNHSYTKQKGSIRGMHYQSPFKEIKMVRCVSGSVFDVIVDIRKDSPTFLQWYGIELSAVNKKMLYIPEGFAHGFQTLSDDTELLYHHSEFYTPGSEGALRYNDPMIDIKWPEAITKVSERDNAHALLDKNFKGI